jgi:DNA-binding MarR family transcriptional regulator
MIRNGEPLLGSKPSPSASLRVIEALRKLGPLTRRELGEQTGYSRATVSQVTNQLIDSGTLDELGEWEPADGPRARVDRRRKSG